MKIDTNARELAHILAALRLMQRTQSPTTIGKLPESEIFGDHAPLDSNEIDALCERLNYDGPSGPDPLVSALEHLAKYGKQCDVKFIASEALKKGGAK